MFLGHFGLGFAVKKTAPGVSLGVLFMAAQFADLLWPTLVLARLERLDVVPGATVVTPLVFESYPYSHSLLALAAWGVLFAIVYVAATRARVTAGVAIGLLVLSHWLLDVIAHRPDLPLTLSSSTPRFGLGLWNSKGGTLAVEFLALASGVAVYLRTTVARDRIGSIGLWSLVAFLAIVYLATVLGPPPPSAEAVAGSAEAMWLLVAWAFWIDRHRRVVPA
jgi:hypothetical protein